MEPEDLAPLVYPLRPSFRGGPALYAAIGRVAYESALTDELLREVLCDLDPFADGLWWLFEGQSSEWLCNSAATMLEHVDPNHSVWPKSVHDDFLAQLAELRGLRPLRNAVVHGIWTNSCDEETLPRPWGGTWTDEDPPYFCSRSRPRTVFESRAFTATDVDVLAKKINDARSRLVEVFLSMSIARGDRQSHGPLPRWRSE